MKLDFNKVKDLIILSLREDIGKGDITTNSCISGSAKAKAIVSAKEKGILCGVQIIDFIFRIVDKNVIINHYHKDGDSIKKGDRICEIYGNARSILSVERTILNFLQQLSGVSTTTKQYVDKIKKHKTRLLDTRKTIPGMRYLQKYAVKCGGGENHRRGLYDMVLIKDNHIKVAGSIKKAVFLARDKSKKNFKIEVECSTLEEVDEALDTDCDWIMLDNMSVGMIKKSIKKIKNKKIIELSGGINLKNISSFARLGADYISVGAITHSYRSLDISINLMIK